MSTVLPLEKLTTILQIFAQEMTVVVANNHGYILKYVGDAIMVYFPVPPLILMYQVKEQLCVHYICYL
jgi:class 3 adenylate cyclase